MYQSITLAAGVAVEFTEVNDFFRILESSLSDIAVTFYANGREVSKAQNLKAGYSERFKNDPFDRVRISSATGGTVEFVTRLGNDVAYDKAPVGTMIITNVNGAFTHTTPTVTNASTTLKAANPNRRYILIQNNDASGIVYVRFDGATATATNGLKLAPGQSYEASNFGPTGAITAIGSIASNANVIVIEG